MNVRIVMTEACYDEMRANLFPVTNNDEHCGFAIAGVSLWGDDCRLLLRKYLPSDESCYAYSSGMSVSPRVEYVQYSWLAAKQSGSSIIKIHTHPFSHDSVRFSSIDDRNDARTFPREVAELGPGPHASIVFGKGSVDARFFNIETKKVEPVGSIVVLGSNYRVVVPTSAQLKRCSYVGGRNNHEE